ncbi:formate dehydrogenase [Shewanella avicenniae]|uniref:Formate dehydrogenase n=1 Tax=Shewanella avicenniae TaxID=2814294 RepID=A0ABX7QS97_9GAMM|nr:formate dehydrogenase [Shewanella avicenniae]QSX33561.1 formate dehydrogenase [Shewanella avicenniae]
MTQSKPDLSRRSLLKALTAGSVASAAVAATGVSANDTKPTEEHSVKANGYRETEHVRHYYNSLR